MIRLTHAFGRSGLAFLVFLVALPVWLSPAAAQNGGPGPTPLVLAPDVVDVRSLPPQAHIPAGGEVLAHFPDLDLLIQHKVQLQRGSTTPPPTTVIAPTGDLARDADDERAGPQAV